METSVFIDPAVAGLLETNFVEARLHTDTHEEFRDLEIALMGSFAQPVYAVVDADNVIRFPDPEFDPSAFTVLSRRDGATSSEDFLEFLRKGMGEARLAAQEKSAQ